MSLLRRLAPFDCVSQRRAAPRSWIKPPRKGVVACASIGEEICAPSSAFKNQLEALKNMTIVVADTGELELVKKYKPIDCTTNPSLVYRALAMPENRHFLEKALATNTDIKSDVARPFAGVADQLSVDLGCELLKVVPGRVSTEVDANLSYSMQPTVDKALRLMDLYAANGIDPSRVYIKLASTWEGIEACRRLEKQGISCNMTLLFTFAQAAACADAGASLISPFGARVMEWYKAKEGREFTIEEHPGVIATRRMYNYYKAHGYKTLVMPASWRSIGEVQALAGCDKMTIPPWLLDELEKFTAPLKRQLSPQMATTDVPNQIDMTEETFIRLHTVDELQLMKEKVKEGIDAFAADQKKLEDLLASIASAKA